MQLRIIAVIAFTTVASSPLTSEARHRAPGWVKHKAGPCQLARGRRALCAVGAVRGVVNPSLAWQIADSRARGALVRLLAGRRVPSGASVAEGNLHRSRILLRRRVGATCYSLASIDPPRP